MAGAVLRFNGGYLGFERCNDPDTGKQYLRATIHHSSTGRTTSCAVELKDVFEFATETVRQALLADGHDKSKLKGLTWQSPLSPKIALSIGQGKV